VVQLNDREVYDKYAAELCRFASTLVGPTDADDVVSSVFVRVIASGALAGVDNQRAYLFRAVLNEARSNHRSATRRLEREAALATSGLDEDRPADADLFRALGQLTVRQRAVLWLAYWIDAPVVEIASTLDLSKRTVERALQIARQRLEEELS